VGVLIETRRRLTYQCDVVDEPVARLLCRLVRADDVRVRHHERKVPRERRGGGDDGKIRRGGHLCQKEKKKQASKKKSPKIRYTLSRGRGRRTLTLHREVLAGRDGADAGEGDGHDGRRGKGRQKRGDEVGIGEMGLDGRDAKSGVVGGLGINEGAQERKSEGGCEEKHGERRVHCYC